MDTALKHAPDRPPGQHRTPLSPYRLLMHPQDLLGRGDTGEHPLDSSVWLRSEGFLAGANSQAEHRVALTLSPCWMSNGA